MVDRGAGLIVAVSYWDEPAHSSAVALTRARADAVAAAGGDLVVESFEVALQDWVSVAATGAVVRMARVRIEPATVTEALGFIHDEMLPRLRIEGPVLWCRAHDRPRRRRWGAPRDVDRRAGCHAVRHAHRAGARRGGTARRHDVPSH